ncbi:MAG: M23 family metallopeptidase [Mycobacteriales bacterium]
MLVVAAPPSLAAPGDVPLLLRPGARAAAPPTAAARWTWPLPDHPRVTRGFDPPATLYGPGHRGVDLAGYAGEPVLAAGAGVVGFAGLVAGRGVVTVRHPGGLKTTYEPVRPVVRTGQAVTVGARVGRLDDGHPDCPVPACLHWGLLGGDAYLDPLLLLGRVRLRLLPLGTGPT